MSSVISYKGHPIIGKFEPELVRVRCKYEYEFSVISSYKITDNGFFRLQQCICNIWRQS
jgi:hypothetical protein